MENTVDMMQGLQVQDDAVQTADNTPTLAEVLAQPEASAQEQAPEPAEGQEPKEAGWIKTRIQKGVEKELAGVEARIRAEYEAKYAPLHEAYLNQEADKLVSTGKIADRDMALEYLKLRGGEPIKQQTTTPQPRDEQGRFASQKQAEGADATQRARDLFTQSKAIEASTGVDVMAVYRSDPDVQQKVLSGEWDFTDVYKSVAGGSQQAAPPLVRSANGGSMSNVSFRKMDSKDLAKVNQMLASGGKIDMRR